MTRQPMPRLSKTLTGPRDPEHCQSCSQEVGDLTFWVECDEHDQPDQPRAVIVALCTPCGERLIEPHPRLYHPLERWRPWPGIMNLCIDCRHRRGLSCMHPSARANGGPGMKLTHPTPTVGWVDGRGKGGRRQGWRLLIFHGPVTACEGREEVAHADESSPIPA